MALGVIGRNSSHMSIVNVVLELVYLQRESAIGSSILPVAVVISLLAVKLIKCYAHPVQNYV